MNLSIEFWKLIQSWIWSDRVELCYMCLVLNTSERVVKKIHLAKWIKIPLLRDSDFSEIDEHWQIRSLTSRPSIAMISRWSSGGLKVLPLLITIYRKGKYAMSQRNCRSPHDLFGLLMISWESLGRTIN